MFSRAVTATRAIVSRHPLFLQPVVTFAPPPLRAASFPLDMDGNSMFVFYCRVATAVFTLYILAVSTLKLAFLLQSTLDLGMETST